MTRYIRGENLLAVITEIMERSLPNLVDPDELNMIELV